MIEKSKKICSLISVAIKNDEIDSQFFSKISFNENFLRDFH